MHMLRSPWLGLVLGLAALCGSAGTADAQAVFHGGMTDGIVRDATKVGSTIHAVGTWANPGAGGRIDGALWTIDGVNPPARTALPDLCTTGAAGCNQNVAAGEAISPDAAYIASQARSQAPLQGQAIIGNGPTAVRVTRSPLSNLNLTPFPTFTTANNPKFARTVSDDGSIMYGQVGLDLGGGVFRNRAVRFDANTGAVTQLFPQPANDGAGFSNLQAIVPRGASADGSVAIGSTFTNGPLVDSRAFRYVHGTGASLIPLLAGGTFNAAFAISGNGNIVALNGDTTAFPDSTREFYTFTASAPAGSQISRLGLPNSGMTPTGSGGITDDGAVVVANSVGSCAPAPCNPDRYAYFHNSHGWFNLTHALWGGGASLDGWRNLQAFGVNGEGTLAWGSGLHWNGSVFVPEGFVAEFPANYLRDFDPQPGPVTDTRIVGAWAFSENGLSDPANPDAVIAFMADGTFYLLGDSFERGFYSFNGSCVTTTTLVDTNGSEGLSDDNGKCAQISITGDTLTAPDGYAFQRITGQPGSLVGAWVAGDPTQADNSFVFVMTSSGKFFFAEDGDPATAPGGKDGVEVGTATWDPNTGTLTNVAISIDTNGQWGLSHSFGTITAQVTADGLGLLFGDTSGTGLGHRIVDPATVVPVVTDGSVQGTLNAALTPFATSATYAVSFSLAGGPAWLSIDATTGVITGTPTEVGFFPVTVTATNRFGDTGSGSFNLAVASVTAVGGGIAVPVAPVVPAATPPLQMTFDSVQAGGAATVSIVNPQTAPALPANFQIAVTGGGTPLYYDISTTATFNGAVTLCFSYAGVNLGGGTPRLLHYDQTAGAWVDVTTSVDSTTQTLCGTTTSFSPFAIATSPTPFVTVAGFHSPVSPLAGFVNAAKAGSTVPLKFEVFVNGVEKTETSGLTFAVTPVACTVSPEDPVDYVTQDSTNLRYDTEQGQFILNWKTPKTAGCFTARVSDANGPLVSAAFKLK